MTRISDKVNPGVATGDDVQYIFKIAKENQFAIPAVNVVSTDSINAVLGAFNIATLTLLAYYLIFIILLEFTMRILYGFKKMIIKE